MNVSACRPTNEPYSVVNRTGLGAGASTAEGVGSGSASCASAATGMRSNSDIERAVTRARSMSDTPDGHSTPMPIATKRRVEGFWATFAYRCQSRERVWDFTAERSLHGRKSLHERLLAETFELFDERRPLQIQELRRAAFVAASPLE